MKAVHTARSWILPVLLILFLLEMLLLPSVLQLTYAGSGQSQDHILTYTPGRLVWDSQTPTVANGSAVLSLFDTAYSHVSAENGDRVLAPGTAKDSRVRLKNEAGRTVTYTAVLYTIRSSEQLPVQSAMSGEGFADTDRFPLPPGVEPSSVVRAVTGSLGGGQIADFRLEWLWNFEDTDNTELQDRIDTYLGNLAADQTPDEVMVGLYIVIQDDGQAVPPSPDTGDSASLVPLLGLIAVSTVLLLLLLLGKRRKEPCV